MQFINNIKGLYLVAALALAIIGVYLYTFFNRTKPPEVFKPKYPADEAFVLKDLKYGKDTLNYLDLYLPKNRNAQTPLLIIIHGGAWVQGDKGMFWTDMATDFYDEKICVANINYRLAPKAKLNDMLADIRGVLLFLKNNASNFSLDVTKVHLLGTSAGGHLALLYAYTLGEKDIKSVTSFAGPTNFNDDNFYLLTQQWGLPNLYKDVLGRDYIKNESEVIKASPIHNIKNIPVLLIHALDDDVVPFSQSKVLADSLQFKKIKNQLFTLPNGKHSPYGLNNSFKGVVNETVLKFIAK